MSTRHSFTMRAIRLLIVGLAMVSASTSLFAHLAATRTYPMKDASIAASPDRVQVWFSEAPEVAVSGLTLAGPDGAIPLGPLEAGESNSVRAVVKTPLGKGAYTVSYKTAGKDGHALRGAFKFQVTPAPARE